MLTIDSRCNDPGCSQNIYRMVGSCSNCGTEDILILYSERHEAAYSRQCPVCGCSRVTPKRLATEDEIPEAAAKKRGEKNA